MEKSQRKILTILISSIVPLSFVFNLCIFLRKHHHEVNGYDPIKIDLIIAIFLNVLFFGVLIHHFLKRK